MSKPVKVKNQKERIQRAMPTKKEDKEILEQVGHSISIAEAMNECLWLGDKNHKTIYVNPVYEKTSGYSLKECIGKPADFCFDEESKKTITQHHKLRDKGIASQYEATMVSKTGKKTPLLISGAPTKKGGTIGIFINLTKVKKLSRHEKLSEQIIRNTSEAIVALNKKSRITMWSNGAKKIFGYNEKEVLNKKLSNLVIPKQEKERNKSLIDQVEEKNYIKYVEGKRITKTGKIIDVIISVTKVTDEKYNFIGYLVIYRDVTDQKKINTELQKRFEAIQDAYKELGLQKRQNDYLYEIIERSASEDTLENLTKLIVSASCMLTKCDGAVLRLHDKENNRLKLYSSVGVSDKWLTKNSIFFENSLAKETCENKRPLIIQNLTHSEKHQGTKLAAAHGFTTLILIPLIVNDKILGSLSLYATDPGKFRLIETDFLERFGKQCSIAIFAKAFWLFHPKRKHKKIKNTLIQQNKKAGINISK
ncbi:PAS domain S-box protein [Candidatus Peregrinibacteria bacterium]|nr:PAS domain S-box protein [Candidatus Peregrinibacteria bacterium]